MRIIAGRWRSRRLLVPKSETTRPMPDRVKEAIFNMLGSHYGCPGELPPLHVADVFAGGGSVGLEALSRGAASCEFFERAPSVIETLKHNLAEIGVGQDGVVVRGDAWKLAVARTNGERFDLVLLDPPFRDSADCTPQGPVRRYLARLVEQGYTKLLVVLHREVEHEGSADDFDNPWRVLERREYGRNVIVVLTL